MLQAGLEGFKCGVLGISRLGVVTTASKDSPYLSTWTLRGWFLVYENRIHLNHGFSDPTKVDPSCQHQPFTLKCLSIYLSPYLPVYTHVHTYISMYSYLGGPQLNLPAMY